MENKQLDMLEATKTEEVKEVVENKGPKKEKNKKTDVKTEPKVVEEKKYIAPFGFAFGPQRLEVVPGAVVGTEYTIKQIKDLMISIGINELRAPDASLHYIKEENIFVLTNILQKKGAGTISARSLEKIEARFVATYLENRTEDRALIYRNKRTGQEQICFPDNEKSFISLEGAPEMYLGDNLDWPLHADLHSHHVLGGTPSETDNANEQVRGIIFGIANWEPNQINISWNFRKWTGNDYKSLINKEVVHDA